VSSSSLTSALEDVAFHPVGGTPDFLEVCDRTVELLLGTAQLEDHAGVLGAAAVVMSALEEGAA